MKKKKFHKNKFNIFKILSILLIIIFLWLVPIVIQKLIKINKIECKSQYGQCPEQLVYRISYIANKDYKTVKKQIEQTLKQNIQINNYVIQYKIPNTLEIEINIKKTKHAIKNSNNYFLIDKDGFVLEIANESILPTLIKTNADYKIGDQISDSDKFALQIIEKVAWLYSVQTGIVNKDLKITLKEGVLVSFPLEGDVDTLVGSLRLIFSRLNDGTKGIKMSDVKEIDLRFKNVILR